MSFSDRQHPSLTLTTFVECQFGFRWSETVQKLLLSINDTAHALSLGRTKVYALISQGKLETVKVGRRTLVPIASLLAFTASL